MIQGRTCPKQMEDLKKGVEEAASPFPYPKFFHTMCRISLPITIICVIFTIENDNLNFNCICCHHFMQ